MTAKRPMNRVNLLAFIAGVFLLASACEIADYGQGSDANDFKESEGITKTAFTLTDSVGAYGKALQNQGWELQKISDIDKVPITPQTIVYMNAEDSIDSNLTKFLTQFKGVFIVDSNYLYPAKYEEVSIADEIPEETGQGAKVADTYLDLMSDVPGKMGKFAPAGTAILVSMNSERFFPVDFSEDGKVNGVPTNEMESIADLKDVVATNVENQPRSWGAWDSDAVVDLNTVTDFYRATAIIFVNGYKSGDNRWFTETQVWTGDKESVCKVQGQWRCGIYPTEDKNIFYSTRGSDGKVNTTGWILKHGAFASAYGAKWVQAYRPGKDLWGSTDLKDNDSYEASYYNGFPMGATVGWSPFSGFSLSLSNTWRFETKGRKSMQSWDGWELQESFQYDRGKNSSGQMLKGTAQRIATGVTMKSDKKKIYTGFEGGGWTNAIDFGQMIGRNTLPNNRDFCQATNRTINKPKMSWEGWMPTIAAIHEFPPSYTSVLSSSNKVLIKAGLIWERQQLKYYFSPQPRWNGNVKCGDSSYRKNIWLLDGRDRVELIDPPTTKKTYQAYKDIYLAHDKF